jgi:hypothetical protein
LEVLTRLSIDVGFDKQTTTTNDPFAAQREGGANTFENGNTAAATENKEAVAEGKSQGDEWGMSTTLTTPSSN